MSARPRHCDDQLGAVRLTDAEARVVAHGVGEDGAIDDLNRVARGWAAGITLLLRAHRAGLGTEAPGGAPPSALFDCFAAEIFEKSCPALRDFLLRTALPARVTPETARALTGNDEAPEILAWLHLNHLFIDRRSQGEAGVVYEYHPLFREFLLERSRREIGADQRNALRAVAAEMVERSGQIEDAAALWIDAHEWGRLTRFVCAHAPRLAAQGRFAAIAAWTEATPASMCAATPWLLYWRSVCRSVRDPGEGRQGLERTYSAFRENGDLAGSFLALAGILATYFEGWGEQQSLDRWLDEFGALLAETGGVIPTEIEAQVIGSASAILFGRPDHPVVKPLVDRGVVLVRTPPDIDQRLAIALFVACYWVWTRKFATARTLASEITSLMTPAASWRWVAFGTWFGTVLWQEAEHAEAAIVLDKALTAARDNGLPLWVPLTQAQPSARRPQAVGTAPDATQSAGAARRPLNAAYRHESRWATLTFGVRARRH